MYNFITIPPWFLFYRETMRHKEIKWFAHCRSGLGNNLAPANKGLLLLGGGSHTENLLPPPTALALVQRERVGLRWDWRRFFLARGQSPGLWDFPQKRSSKEKGLVTKDPWVHCWTQRGADPSLRHIAKRQRVWESNLCGSNTSHLLLFPLSNNLLNVLYKF